MFKTACILERILQYNFIIKPERSKSAKPKVFKKLNKNRAVRIENLTKLAEDNYVMFQKTGDDNYLKESKKIKEEIEKLCVEQERRLKEEFWRCK